MDLHGVTSTVGNTTVFRFLTAGTLSILVLAILVGLVAAYAIRSFLVAEKPPREEPPGTIKVPLSSADLPEGRMVRLGDISLVPMTPQQLNSQDWPIQSVMLSADQVIGRTLLKPMKQGKPFLTTELYLEGSGPEYTKLLTRGNRAVSLVIPFDRGGYVNPGSSVDVLFRATPRAGSKNTSAIPETTITLIQGAQVLAIERPLPPTSRLGPPGGIDLRTRDISSQQAPPTVVLAVAIDDANRLQAVLGRGEISLVSRPPGETDTDRPPGPVRLEDILGIEPPVPPEPVAIPPRYLTEIYRGTERGVNGFRAEGNRFVPVSASDMQ
jgi:Flp pilus assembly protein CpaB